MRHPTPEPPAEIAMRDGLAYTLWMPEGDAEGGVVILHGAGSCKESHHDFARTCRSAGLAALAFDQRGHGESDAPLDGRILQDVTTMAGLLRSRLPGGNGPIALRGSSMGGYLALMSARPADADAVVAICPAGAEHLLRGLRSGTFQFAADRPAVESFFESHDLEREVAALRMPMLLLHAEGDDQIPVAHSRSLFAAAGMERKKLIDPPGGHHRSLQHDDEMQGEAVRFIGRAFRMRGR